MTNLTPGHRPAWVDNELFPFVSKFLRIDGHTIHYVDEGHGPLLLLYHGNPTWSFLYRRLIADLRDRFRCMAFDYPGMGLSTADPAFSYRAPESSGWAPPRGTPTGTRQWSSETRGPGRPAPYVPGWSTTCFPPSGDAGPDASRSNTPTRSPE
jgi:pimeloyl-ACP methyl ester carboxylesterase